MTRLLVADDHPFILAGLEAILRDTDFDIAATRTDGQGVLDSLALLQPDMLLMDVAMPSCSGIDVVRTLRGKGNPLPVVLLTGNLEDDRLAEALDLGIEGIVLKESAQAQLLTCLETVRDGGSWIEPALCSRAAAMALEPPPAAPLIDQLAPREREIVALVGRGLRNRDVAERLGMTEGSIKVYLHRIYDKMEVQNRTELALATQAFSSRKSRNGTN